MENSRNWRNKRTMEPDSESTVYGHRRALSSFQIHTRTEVVTGLGWIGWIGLGVRVRVKG